MTTINEQMGLPRAGKRSMMKNLPADRAERARLTSAHCPQCDRTGAKVSKVRPGWLWCTWCTHTWEPTP